MTKKLNSLTASQASTSTLPRLSFKQTQPKPEIFLKFGPGVFSPTVHRPDVVQRQDRRHGPADPHAGVRRVLVASPGSLRGSVWRWHGCHVSAWSICGDKGLGLTPTASALPSQCYCGPE